MADAFDAAMGNTGDTQSCAICFDSTDLILMPCCGREQASTRFCQRCIEIICEMAHGALGKCPKCRKAVQVANGQVVVAVPRRGKCRMCNQGNKAIVEAGQCDACLFGSRYVLGYECDRCHCTQRIPHPMWRYCASPDGFSTSTWACHQRCGDYTHWRVIPCDVPRVRAQAERGQLASARRRHGRRAASSSGRMSSDVSE